MSPSELTGTAVPAISESGCRPVQLRADSLRFDTAHDVADGVSVEARRTSSLPWAGLGILAGGIGIVALTPLICPGPGSSAQCEVVTEMGGTVLALGGAAILIAGLAGKAERVKVGNQQFTFLDPAHPRKFSPAERQRYCNTD